MITIVLDTNFLVYCAKEKLDYDAEIGRIINEGHELAVPIQVYRELEKLKKKAKSYKDKAAADLALQLLEINKVIVLENKLRNADIAIMTYGKLKDFIIATLDKELRFKLGRAIVISNGNKLMFVK
jgi:rRNA-processing protein FCF1